MIFRPLIKAVSVFLCFAGPCFADRPVFHDDVLAGNQKWRTDFGMTYTPVSTPPQVAQVVGPEDRIQAIQTRSEIILTTLGLRYGIAGDIEISIGAGFEKGRESLIAGGIQRHRSHWQGPSFFSLGASYQAVEDQRFPGVVLFIDAKVVDWTGWVSEDYDLKQRSVLKSFGFGTVVYHRLDPIVLFLSASHAIEIERTVSGRSINPPNVLQIQPGFNFSINEDVTTSVNVSWSRSHDWVANEARRGAAFSNVLLNAGLNFRLHHRLSTVMTAGLNATGTTYPILGFSTQVDL